MYMNAVKKCVKQQPTNENHSTCALHSLYLDRRCLYQNPDGIHCSGAQSFTHSTCGLANPNVHDFNGEVCKMVKH